MLTAQEIFKQRAMLSRLGSIADVVAMFVLNSLLSRFRKLTSLSQTCRRCGSRPTRFDDVCTAVTNSPLLSIGFDEADESLTFLAARFPDFCCIKLIGSTGNVTSSLKGGERWIVLSGGQKPKEVKEKVRDELNQTEAKA